MRIFRYKREKTFGTHNFGSHQIYVCNLSDTKGNEFKGISIHYPGSFAEVPFPLDEEQASKLIMFLSTVLNSNVSSSFTLKCGIKNYFINLYLNFSPFNESMIKSKIKTGNLFGINFMSGKIKRSSISACLTSLRSLYNA